MKSFFSEIRKFKISLCIFLAFKHSPTKRERRRRGTTSSIDDKPKPAITEQPICKMK